MRAGKRGAQDGGEAQGITEKKQEQQRVGKGGNWRTKGKRECGRKD